MYTKILLSWDTHQISIFDWYHIQRQFFLIPLLGVCFWIHASTYVPTSVKTHVFEVVDSPFEVRSITLNHGLWSWIKGQFQKRVGGGGTSYTMGVPLPPPKCHKNFTNFHPHCALVLRQILCWWTWNMVHHPNLHIKSTICISCLCAWVYSHCKWAYSSIGANRPRRTIPSIGSYVHTKALPKVQPIEIDGFIAHALTRTRCKALS